MKKLRDFINPQTSSDQIDKTMEDLLEQKFRDDKRARYADLLKKNHGISRDDQSDLDRPGSSLGTKIILPLIFIAALVGGWYLLNNTDQASSKVNQEEMIFAYLDDNPVAIYDNTRGDNQDVTEMRVKAQEAFENQDFETAVKMYTQIEEITTEDLFYKSYANLKLKNYSEAQKGFLNCDSKLSKGEKYKAEAKLYLVLTQLANGLKEDAKNSFDQLDPSSWESKQLKKFFD